MKIHNTWFCTKDFACTREKHENQHMKTLSHTVFVGCARWWTCCICLHSILWVNCKISLLTRVGLNILSSEQERNRSFFMAFQEWEEKTDGTSLENVLIWEKHLHSRLGQAEMAHAVYPGWMQPATSLRGTEHKSVNRQISETPTHVFTRWHNMTSLQGLEEQAEAHVASYSPWHSCLSVLFTHSEASLCVT